MRRSRRGAGLAVAMLATVVLGGCGSLATPPRGTFPDRPYRLLVHPEPVPAAAVDAWPEGSPERTVLAWFRALQTHDLAAAQRLYAGSGAPTLRELEIQRRAAAAQLREVSFYRLLDVARQGDRATVYSLLVRRFRAPNGQVDSVTQPQAFEVRRVGSRWLMGEDFYLRQLLNLQRAQQRNARSRAGGA